jgi:prepilin-type N-terminal cleavage/methylation domain-containing protein
MKKGFTLVELMVVVGILSIIMLTISQPVAGIIKYQRESQTADNMRDNLQFVINKIEKELKTSSNVYVNDDRELKFKDQEGGFVTYKLEGKTIKRNNVNFTDNTVFNVEKLNFIVTDKRNLSKLVTVSIDAKSLDGKDSVTMQTSINPVNDKPVITDGITVHLDAGNRNSYSGTSGARWVSLVNPAATNTGIIRSGVTHSNNDGGYFRFNGTANGYFNTQVPTISGSTNYSASLWINMDSWNRDKDTRFFWHGEYAAMIMKFSPGNSLVSYLRNISGGSEPRSSFPFTNTLYNKWNHLCITYDGSTSKLYLNGSLISQKNFTGGIVNQQSNKLWLGGLPGSNFWTRANISQVLVYNRALNPEEVEYNYNVTKGRFGIN